MAFQADRVDALLGPLALGEFVQTLDDAFLVEVDGDRSASLGHAQSLGQVVNCDDLLRAKQDGAADRHLANGSASPDGDCIGWFDLALRGRLPSGREDVAKEENLLVR